MQSITLHSRVGSDGIVHLEVPVEVTDTELEVTVTVQYVTPIAIEDSPKGKG